MPKSKKKNILVVDDHPVLRSGLTAILNSQAEYQVKYEAGSENEVLNIIKEPDLLIDLAIVDLSLSKDSGFLLFRHLLNFNPALRILVFSLNDENVYAEKVIKAGAHGYLMKGEPVEVLLEAVDAVLKGELYVSRRMSSQLLRRIQVPSSALDSLAISRLTKTELIVLEYIGKGLSNSEIAIRLNRSAKTIDVHRSNIKRKLNLPTNAALIKFAIDMIE